MPFKSYNEQKTDHINFLISKGFLINDLEIDSPQKEIRCHSNKTNGRGELSYRCTSRQLNNGLLGLGTWFRGSGGEEGFFKTYGHWPTEGKNTINPNKVDGWNIDIVSIQRQLFVKKIYAFWEHSLVSGRSDYLERKGVGCYDIRFRMSIQWGNVAVIPMRDDKNMLWSYQLLNPDGTKRFAKGACTNGLFHALGTPNNLMPIGIAESYVTAATCMELCKIPIICAFSSSNMTNVAMSIRKKYPKAPLIIFADNDRHLNQNQGIIKSHEACNAVKTNIQIIIPDFGNLAASKNASDWNDLVRLMGKATAKDQIFSFFKKKKVLSTCYP